MFWSDEVYFGENQKNLDLFGAKMVVKSRREMEDRMAHVGDDADDVAKLGDSPQLTPSFDVVLEVAQITTFNGI